jgi:phenylpropionate dioxygenase-like ring-hydroxylating dioxygenase large terminal subunit
MYPYKAPLTSSMVHQEWYVVAQVSELDDRTTPLARTILGTPMAILRGPDGALGMVESACPHRSYPLAESPIVDGQIQCGYHGIRFEVQGRCTFIPGANRPGKLGVRSYPVVERAGLVWAWMGDAADADPSRLPGLGRPEIDGEWPHMDEVYADTLQTRSIALIENLMDLSHLSYLHGSVIQDTTIADRPLDVEESGDIVTATRHMRDVPYGGLEAALYGAVPGSGTYDWDNLSTYLAPSLIVTGVQPLPGSPEAFGGFRFIHAVTPETETSTHYWVKAARDFRVHDEQVDGVFAAMNTVIPYQDKAALEAIESLSDEVKFRERYQHFDRAALDVRHRVERRLMAEQGIAARSKVRV